ncbi:hypothetical protein PBY51_016725 [Eleginops maclovinus]|uniref:Uncharacterized protein n=1 Tax=Eleginops maclovinus TaxID=56733 RepID=A0AAN7WQJ4_ELEMC|nr:hypothetical protein PBY51_016725 [Eleginops maclovinus]
MPRKHGKKVYLRLGLGAESSCTAANTRRSLGKKIWRQSRGWPPGRVIVLLWLLLLSPSAINAGVQLSLWIGCELGDTHRCRRTHHHMEHINIITNSKQRVMGSATQPGVIQSEQPLTHSPKVIGLGGLGWRDNCADNWLIDVKPLSQREPHLGSGADPLRRRQGV